MRKLAFLAPVTEFLDSVNQDTRRYLIGVCRRLRDDPFVDGRTKHYQVHAPEMERWWGDGKFQIRYLHEKAADPNDIDNETVVIVEIGFEDPEDW